MHLQFFGMIVARKSKARGAEAAGSCVWLHVTFVDRIGPYSATSGEAIE